MREREGERKEREREKGERERFLLDNNYIKDFPQLADGLMVIPLPVEEQCRGVLSEPQPDLQLLTGDAQFSEAAGYPMVQHWRVRSNLYKVKLSSITLSSGFSKILKTLSAESTREELLAFLQQFGTHYVSEALYGSELSCTIHFPSKKAQQQLWLQYQKEATEQSAAAGGRRELKSLPFISYLSALQKSQLLSDDIVNGVEISCEEKGSCPPGCHLCHHQGMTGAVSTRGTVGKGGTESNPHPPCAAGRQSCGAPVQPGARQHHQRGCCNADAVLSSHP
ncbi:hypothetical protein WMY93_021355 [Mugilogobius chulae]|uniref:MACPF domain-containing protein n=1 Tax=Mugilogobius chulae TaxID=88201 RepID=A0AAW0NBN7_9GOBI